MGIGIGSGCGIGIGRVAQSSPERTLPPQFKTLCAASAHTVGSALLSSVSSRAVAAESRGASADSNDTTTAAMSIGASLQGVLGAAMLLWIWMIAPAERLPRVARARKVCIICPRDGVDALLAAAGHGDCGRLRTRASGAVRPRRQRGTGRLPDPTR